MVGTTNHDESARKAVLLTGATGFVGGELLKRLLANDNGRKIICPVRASSIANATQRGIDTLTAVLGRPADQHELQRVEWIRSDLEEHRLGWSSPTWDRIAEHVDEVFHCAASVSFDLELDEAQRINVDGTVHVHELAKAAARHHQMRRFHHVSTAYVSGKSNTTVDANYLPPDRARHFRNTYERTKARAERYLRSSTRISGAVPVSIYRPSIVAGDTHGGRTTNWNVLYVPMKLVARGHLPMFPYGGKAIVDSVGVDVLVDAMLALGESASFSLHAYHVTAGNEPFDLHTLLRVTAERAAAHDGYKPSRTNLVSIPRWNSVAAAMAVAARAPKQLGGLRARGAATTRGMRKCAVYVPYTQVDTVFDASREYKLLQHYGISMPSGREYLETIVDYALDTGFGKSAPTVVEPRRVPAAPLDTNTPTARMQLSEHDVLVANLAQATAVRS